MEQQSNEELKIIIEALKERIEKLEKVVEQNAEQNRNEHRNTETEITNIKIADGRTEEQYISIMKTLNTLVDKVDKITSRPLKYVEYFLFTIIGGIVMWVINMITKGE